MAYYINGQRMTYQEAAIYLAMQAALQLHMEFDKVLSIVSDYLFTVKPGTERIYANMRISCGRA
jgi:hypothetical protein